MTDNQLAILFRAQLLAGLARHGLSAVPVVASYQPTSEGRVTEAAIYFFALPESRHGWQGRRRKVNLQTHKIDTTEVQIIQGGFQVFALAPQDPQNLALPTAKDLVNIAAMICNSQVFAQAMHRAGVGVQRVTEIRNPYFVNDQGQFEASPSFDIKITHQRSLSEITPVVDDFAISIHRV